MTTITTGYMTASYGMLMPPTAPKQPDRKYQVRAYDADGDRITHLNGRLDEQYFANADEVREKLALAIKNYNDVAIFPVAKLEVYFVDKFAEADIEDIVTVKTESGIGEFKYRP